MNLEKIYNDLGSYLVKDDIEIIRNVMREIETEIITNGKVNKGIKSAFKRLLKVNDYREGFQQVYTTLDGFYVICNGYFLVDFGKDKNNVPKELQAYINIAEISSKTIDFEHVKLNESENIKEYTINVTDLEKIHKYNKINTEDLIPYRIENKYINADYLLDVITFMGMQKSKTITIRMTDNPIAPLEIINGETKSMLLPIRVTDDLKEHYDAKNIEILNV